MLPAQLPKNGWRPPTPVLVKVNVDTAVKDYLRYIRVGVVIRDGARVVLAAASKRYRGRFTPHIAKCLAACAGMKRVVSCGFGVWQLASDSHNIVRSIQRRTRQAPEASYYR